MTGVQTCALPILFLHFSHQFLSLFGHVFLIFILRLTGYFLVYCFIGLHKTLLKDVSFLMTLHWCVGFEVYTIRLCSSLHLGLCNFLCWFSELYFVVCIMKNIKMRMGLCNFLCWFSGLYFVVCLREALGARFHLVIRFLRSIVWLSFVIIFCHLVWLYLVLWLFFF